MLYGMCVHLFVHLAAEARPFVSYFSGAGAAAERRRRAGGPVGGTRAHGAAGAVCVAHFLTRPDDADFTPAAGGALPVLQAFLPGAECRQSKMFKFS